MPCYVTYYAVANGNGTISGVRGHIFLCSPFAWAFKSTARAVCRTILRWGQYSALWLWPFTQSPISSATCMARACSKTTNTLSLDLHS